MAVLKKLEDQLNCSICLETYTDPKLLQCNHVYCQQCLVRLVVQDRQGQFILTCPNCRQVTPVPASGVAGLQAEFHVNQLLEIVEEHKKAKDATASFEKAESASTSPTPHENITVGCPEHNKEVELYCETCEQPICFKCAIKGGEHVSHNYEELGEAFERYKEEIMSSLEPLEEQLTIIKKAVKVLDARHDEISDQQATIETDILNTITRLQATLHQTLEVRKTELIGQLDQLTQAKLKSLAVQRDQIETTQAQLSSCLLFLRENLKTGNQGEALMMKSTTVRQVKELTITFQPDILVPSTKADLIFSELADLSAECQNYGKVYAAGPPDPSKCHVTGKGVDTEAVGEKLTAILPTLDSNSQPSKASNSCELTSEIAGTRARGSVERRRQSSYQPPIKGRQNLHITVEGQHIRGSLFPSRPVEKLGSPILTIGGEKGPRGVAVNRRGEVVVTECNGHCVTVFSPSGERLRSFGMCGSGQGQFQFPYGVAVDGEENILVADHDNHRVQKFTAQGEFLTAVGTEGSRPLQFQYPRGIAVSASNGRVYVVDGWNKRIQMLNSDLSYAGIFGKAGNGKGQFDDPRHIACDSTGNVYVADCDNHHIQVFTAEGKFLRMFGRCGEGRGELNGPLGVAVDSSDRVYVGECGNHRVSVFTSEGQFATSFGSEGAGPGQFRTPLGLAVDSNGVVYVCDLLNDRVQLF